MPPTVELKISALIANLKRASNKKAVFQIDLFILWNVCCNNFFYAGVRKSSHYFLGFCPCPMLTRGIPSLVCVSLPLVTKSHLVSIHSLRLSILRALQMCSKSFSRFLQSHLFAPLTFPICKKKKKIPTQYIFKLVHRI